MLYIGDSQGKIQLYDTRQRSFVTTFDMFQKEKIKPRPINQVMVVRDPDIPCSYYVVGVRHNKKKIAILNELHKESPVTHFKFANGVITAAVNRRWHDGHESYI